MRKSRIIAIFTVFVIILSVFVGCGDGGEPVSAELLQQLLDTGSGVTGYRMAGTTVIKGGGQNKFSLTADFSSLCDVKNRNLSVKTDIEMLVPGVSIDSSQMSEIYLFSDEMYQGERSAVSCMQWVIDGKPTGWMSKAVPYSDMPSHDWEDNNQLLGLVDLISDKEIRLIRSEPLRGADCYVFEVRSSKDGLIETVLKQPGIGYLLEDIESTELRGMVDSLTVRAWVSKDASQILKAETEMRLNMAGDSADVLMSMDFYDHNMPQEITLPADCPVWPPPADDVWMEWNMAQS